MASALIHLTVAKRINEHYGFKGQEEKEFLFGSIAPDIAKLVGSERWISHFFIDKIEEYPNIDRFVGKYKEYLNNPYELGYLVHLLTDVIWTSEFLPNFVDDLVITSKDGTRIKFETQDEVKDIIYNDYSNLNSQILSYYNYDLSLFYEEFEFPENHIKEVDSKYFPDVIDKLGTISTNMANANYIISIEQIIHFIEFASLYCIDRIKEIN